MATPNFFIVGAPKCGTSTLYHWLRARPDIYLPYNADAYWRYKEPYHYCRDLVAPPHRVEKAEYETLFSGAESFAHIGEATAINLFSDAAPAAIKYAAPDAKIIIMLRPPVEFIVSWWRHCLYFALEDETDFAKAIDADRTVSTLPEKCWYPRGLAYRKMARFSGHIRRYLAHFDRRQIHFIHLAAMRAAPYETLQGVLAFLGAKELTGEIDLRAHNVSPGVRRSIHFERALAWRIKRAPQGDRLWRGIEQGLKKFLPDIAQSIDPALIASLDQEFAGEAARIDAVLSAGQ